MRNLLVYLFFFGLVYCSCSNNGKINTEEELEIITETTQIETKTSTPWIKGNYVYYQKIDSLLNFYKTGYSLPDALDYDSGYICWSFKNGGAPFCRKGNFDRDSSIEIALLIESETKEFLKIAFIDTVNSLPTIKIDYERNIANLKPLAIGLFISEPFHLSRSETDLLIDHEQIYVDSDWNNSDRYFFIENDSVKNLLLL